jgi:hypothetical protein
VCLTKPGSIFFLFVLVPLKSRKNERTILNKPFSMPVRNANNKNQKSKIFTYLKNLIFFLPRHIIFFSWTFILDRHLFCQRQALKNKKSDFFHFLTHVKNKKIREKKREEKKLIYLYSI